MTEAKTIAGDQDTASMRAQADQLKAGVREDHRALWERSRRAAQLAYEADLIDTAEAARAEAAGARSRLPRLEEKAAAAIADERSAEDRLRVQRKQLARRQSEQQRARADMAPAERQEELAIRVHVCGQVVSDYERAVSEAGNVRAGAEDERDRWLAHVGELEAEAAAATRKAENPGTAPDAPGLIPGISRPDDMDPEARGLVASLVLLTGQLGGGTSAPGDADRGLAAQDKRGFRHVVHRGQHVVLPPDRRHGASR